MHLFGATSSPSVACFALRHSVANSPCSNNVRKTVQSSFYVDDLLISRNTEDEAISTMVEVKQVIGNCGFNLTNFDSNSSSVLVATSNTAQSSSHIVTPSSDTGRALGVTWKTKKDKFSFTIKIENNDELITKRILLKTIASIYDPIGLVSPIIVPAKRLFQECCRRKIDWDDVLPLDLQSAWKKWEKDVKILSTYEIPRCYKVSLDVVKIDLHTFVDGSETAFGAVTYVRFLYQNSSSVSVVSSKSRLTPLNNNSLKTVPRIELCAAKLGVELACRVKKELDYEIANMIYWSDSTTVLHYIKNSTLRLKRFVHNKVCYIRNFSDAKNWHFVSTNENPSDLISRGTTSTKLINSSLWNHGPSFLSNAEVNLPSDHFDLEEEIVESLEIINPVYSTATGELSIKTSIDLLMESVSSWHKLQCRIASLLQLKYCLRTNTSLKNCQITAGDLNTAEVEIIKYVQKRVYSDAIKSIIRSENVKAPNYLRKLNPFIDNKGMLRVGGRISNSTYNYSIKHPIILPADSHVVELLVMNVHHSVGHLGRESILSALRRKFWIVKGNALARKIVSNCIICKKKSKVKLQFSKWQIYLLED